MSRQVSRFEDLVAWQKSMDLAEEIYRLSESPGLSRKYAFRDQLERAASSVPSNIAEGFERGSRAEFHRFLSIAKASCAELRTRLQLALRVGYLDPTAAGPTLGRAEDVGRVIGKLRAVVEVQRMTPRKSASPSSKGERP